MYYKDNNPLINLAGRNATQTKHKGAALRVPPKSVTDDSEENADEKGDVKIG